MQEKKELRKLILKKRDALTPTEHKAKSRIIAEKVFNTQEFQSCDEFLLFASYKSEVDTTEILEQALSTGKAVYLPKVQGKVMEFYKIKSLEDLKEGYCGIREPEINSERRFLLRKNKRIFVLMPGAVFDRSGGRIGYGGGFYDKFLEKLEAEITSENLCKVAVAFECQMIKCHEITSESHDITPDYVITEDNVYVVKIKQPISNVIGC